MLTEDVKKLANYSFYRVYILKLFQTYAKTKMTLVQKGLAFIKLFFHVSQRRVV